MNENYFGSERVGLEIFNVVNFPWRAADLWGLHHRRLSSATGNAAAGIGREDDHFPQEGGLMSEIPQDSFTNRENVIFLPAAKLSRSISRYSSFFSSDSSKKSQKEQDMHLNGSTMTENGIWDQICTNTALISDIKRQYG